MEEVATVTQAEEVFRVQLEELGTTITDGAATKDLNHQEGATQTQIHIGSVYKIKVLLTFNPRITFGNKSHNF